MIDRKRVLKTVMGRVAGVLGAYTRAFRSTMTIVAFHRISDLMPEDGLTCGSAKFEKFCRFFRTHARVVPFAEQVAACREGRDLRGKLSITFDDGYLDNFEVAAPSGWAIPRTCSPIRLATGKTSPSARASWCASSVSCAAPHVTVVNAPSTSPFHLQRIPIAEWFTSPHQFGFEFVTGRALGRI